MTIDAKPEDRGAALRMPGPPLGNEDPAFEAWALMVRLMMSNKPRMAAIAHEFELAPMQMQALMALEPGKELPMSALAGSLACEASNVTGIVDRLEARGLIERREAPHDRRVKMLAVTPEGAHFRARLGKRMSTPPPAIAELAEPDQRKLGEILRRALEA
jgi:MarR family transcriptional regulator, organic hydroperoxide resistance regulator